MKNGISFACTVFNEEKTIGKFIESVLNQSVKPDEIIIVDGGSKDNTLKIAKNYKKKSKIPIRIFVSRGNIAVGRNRYVQETKYDILFTGDSGTRFEKDWIKKLLVGFEKGADIVIGTYLPEKPVNSIEKIIASRFPAFSKFSQKDWENFIPSNRQIAYKLSSWKKLGKFPEEIDRADDTLMHMKAKKIGLKYYFCRNAKVYWHARNNLQSYLRLAYLDSVSDGISGIAWKRKTYFFQMDLLGILFLTTLFGILSENYLFLLSWPVILGGIFIKEGFPIYKKTRKTNLFLYGGIIMIGLFFAHSIGCLIGAICSPFVRNKTKI